MAQIGNLNVSLSLESASFISNMKKAADQTAKSTASIATNVARVTAAASAFGVVAIGSQLAQVVGSALEFSSSLAEVAQQLGVTTDDLQTFRYAASQVGIEQETMDKGLAKLTRTLGEAAGGAKKPIAAFAELGLSLNDLNGKTSGEVLPLIADGLGKIADPAKRAAIEVTLFGKAGQQLDTLLAGGRGGVDELTNAARRLGLVLSSEQIAKADDAADKLSAVKQVLAARIAGVVADNAASILVLANAFERIIAAAGRGIGKIDAFKRSLFFSIDNRTGGIFRLLDRYQESQMQDLRKPLVVTPGKPRVASNPLDNPKPRKPPATSGGGGGGGRSASRSPSDDGFASLYAELNPVATILSRAEEKAKLLGKHLAGPELQRQLATLHASTKEQLLSLVGGAEKFDDVLDGWKQPLIDFADEARSAAPATAFLEKQVSDGLEASRAAVTELGDAIDRDLIDGLHDLANGFGSLSDVALRVIDDIGRALITQLSPSGSGSIGNVIAGAIIGGLGHQSTGGTSGGGGVSKGLGLRTPGFATGGSGVVAGTGPADSKLVSMRLTPGELVDVRRPGNDNGRAPVVHQTIQFSGAVDVATRAEVYRVASAVKQSTIEAMDNRAGRRG